MTTISIRVRTKPNSHDWNTGKQNSAFCWEHELISLEVSFQIQRLTPAYIKIFRSCNKAMIDISDVRIQSKGICTNNRWNAGPNPEKMCKTCTKL